MSPRLLDKILINGNRAEGSHSAIMAEYKSANALGTEADNAGLLDDPVAVGLRDKLKVSCDKHTAAELAHLQELREVVDELDAFINSKRHP